MILNNIELNTRFPILVSQSKIGYKQYNTIALLSKNKCQIVSTN